MQLRSFYVTERKNGLDFHDYQGFRLVSNGLALIFILIAAFSLKPAMLPIITLVGISKIIESQSDMYYAAVQKVERMAYISYSKFGKGLSALLLVAVCIYLGLSINQILIAWCALWLVILLAFDARITLRISGIKRRVGLVFKKEIFISIFKIALPVLILSFVDKFAANYPNYIVENKLGLSAVAIFGGIIFFRSIGAQVINPMGAVVAPRLTDYWSNGRHADFMHLLRRTTFSAFLLGVAGILVALFFGKWILPLLYTEEYAAYTDLLVLVMVYCLATYMYVFIGTAITCLRVHWVKLPIHIVSFALLATLMFFNAATLSAIVVNMIISETVMFILYTVSFLVLFNKIKGNGYVPKGLFKNIV
jgi:O-antigen/teichoic acid export membrane protein